MESASNPQEPSSTTLLIVDDQPENLRVLTELLQPHYLVRACISGEKALRICHETAAPDLILLDVMMPDMDGYQVFAELRSKPGTREIPVIFVTALGDARNVVRGLELGAVDYVSKPIEPAVLLARVRNQIELKQARDWLAFRNVSLEAEVARRVRENDVSQAVGIRALARLAEIRDPETGNHILRTQAYVQQMAHLLQDHPAFAPTLKPHYIRLLARSAPLHDIGKVGIPDAILLKPGPLTEAEWAVMKTHAKLGSDAIELTEKDSEQPVEFLTLAKEIAHWHHEKWDGSGYPEGLAGEAIPISARIMTVADVFDALISPRVYKIAISFQEAAAIMANGRGRHFDPDVLDVFLEHYPAFVAIAESHRDSAEACRQDEMGMS